MGGGRMKIVFNGMFEKHTKSCNCKRAGNSEYGFVSQKLFHLPSGRERVFQANKVEEVNDADARFLLSHFDTSNGVKREVFSKVED